MDKSVQEIYGNRVRIRVCGLCWEGERLLMVNHKGIYAHDFWAPPGGGVEFGQSAEANLVRELLEETGLIIQVGEFLFACEFIKPPLHAIELFFGLTVGGGSLLTGTDPEMGEKNQIIQEVRYLSMKEIRELPKDHKHGVFQRAETMKSLQALSGYLKI